MKTQWFSYIIKYFPNWKIRSMSICLFVYLAFLKLNRFLFINFYSLLHFRAYHILTKIPSLVSTYLHQLPSFVSCLLLIPKINPIKVSKSERWLLSIVIPYIFFFIRSEKLPSQLDSWSTNILSPHISLYMTTYQLPTLL